jgi:Na+/H+ antiporter NhaD/arsenite permease-like protein
MIFGLSTVLDNIAGAVIGGVVARHVFRNVTIGYLAAIVASANAGGAGSVLGDTTTTMMWISGVSPVEPLRAFIAALAAFAVFGVVCTLQQHRRYPIIKHEIPDHPPVDWVRGALVLVLLAAILAVNLAGKMMPAEARASVPLLGLGLWAAILLTAMVRRPNWSVAIGAGRGAVFLVALVATALAMPVASLPDASWHSTLGMGALSAVFDNIPLTALALNQGGYDWGLLAFAVGFGGSMTWFGSSAGVALSNAYPQIRTVEGWLKEGWAIPVAYVVGFFVLLWTMGWNPA